ncbi:uncharacterized protein LOC129609783 [Condylostylus longicornis]|uniref:uncharacterized protein LOC129609783 n=1 Tax=Condylostylus longicornis TaxID=2530218 RepID=UPI00244DA995|nr:uncharacterized protein LOC129609783 [Condylostylus longicornis]
MNLNYSKTSIHLANFIATIFYIICLTLLPNSCNGHGRLIEPPSRASAWRYGFQTPPNYNDHELYCGGYQRQWSKNGGKCGECGDAWDLPKPRPHEFGGKWGQGVVVRKYNPGSEITIRVELTASHMGYFEFRLCPEIKAKQDCLDKNLLKIITGVPLTPMPDDLDTRFYPRNGSRIYEIKAKLPNDMKCNHCVMQWRYVAGNNWGMCDDGVGQVGCGPQEEFRACADISIGETGRATIRPIIRPGVKIPTTKTSTKTTEKTPTEEETTKDTTTSEELPETIPYIAPIIILLTLLIVICILATIYLYYYHGKRVKELLRWQRRKDVNENSENNEEYKNNCEKTKSHFFAPIIINPPVPPPRNKRPSQFKSFTPEQSSVA